MKMVIDIDENVFTRLFDNGIQDNEIAVDDVCEMARALRLGTPLPKGHGRLIDAGELLEKQYRIDDSATLSVRDVVNDEDVDDAQTIIEADKAESEDKAIEQESCTNIPFLLHKEFGCPLDECVKAYEKANEYLRSKSKLKG